MGWHYMALPALSRCPELAKTPVNNPERRRRARGHATLISKLIIVPLVSALVLSPHITFINSGEMMWSHYRVVW